MAVVLVTGSGTDLAQAITQALESIGSHVVLSHRPGTSAGSGSVECDLLDMEATDALCAGVDQVVHVEPVLDHAPQCRKDDPTAWLDICTTQTYNLLGSATTAGAVSCCCLSTMELYEGYSEALAVQPFWEPLPTCEPRVLGPHLASFIATQFAHSGALRVSLVCIGSLDRAVGTATQSGRWQSSLDEVAEAVVTSLTSTLHTDTGKVGDGAQAPPNIYHPGENRFSVQHVYTSERVDKLSRDRKLPNPWDPPVPMTVHENTIPRSVLVLGSEGMLGPDVARALTVHSPGQQPLELLRLTDVIASPHLRDAAQVDRTQAAAAGDRSGGTAAIPASLPELFKKQAAAKGKTLIEYREVDIADAQAVSDATVGTDCTVVCAVVREHPQKAFDVNTRGCYNAIRAAVKAGHARFVNTSPMASLVGHHGSFHHNINEEM
jgi:nucleoside-diphosphate-sugar epimerase